MSSEAAIILGACILIAAMLAAVSRHKKSGTDDVKLIGATGLVDTKLDPHGTVLIHGELLRACSNDGSSIASRSKVSVVGMRDHLLLVSLQDQYSTAIRSNLIIPDFQRLLSGIRSALKLLGTHGKQ